MAEVTRLVFGRVLQPIAEDGAIGPQPEAAPWPGARLVIQSADSYTATAVLPARQVKVVAGEDGSFFAPLVPGRYTVTMPSGARYPFGLEMEDGSPIALSVLIAADIDTQDPRYPTLLAALDGPASAATAAAIAAGTAATRADTAAVAAESIVSRHTGLLLLQETADTVVLRAVAPVTLTDSTLDVVVGGTTYTLDTVLIQGA